MLTARPHFHYCLVRVGVIIVGCHTLEVGRWGVTTQIEKSVSHICEVLYVIRMSWNCFMVIPTLEGDKYVPSEMYSLDL